MYINSYLKTLSFNIKLSNYSNMCFSEEQTLCSNDFFEQENELGTDGSCSKLTLPDNKTYTDKFNVKKLTRYFFYRRLAYKFLTNRSILKYENPKPDIMIKNIQ